VNLCQVVFSDNVELMNWVSIGMIAFYSVVTVITRPFSEHFSLVCHNADFRNAPIRAFRLRLSAYLHSSRVGLRCNSCWPQVLVLTMNLITAFALFLSVRASHHDDLEAELPTWIVVCLYMNMAFMCVFVLHELYPMIELFQETWYLRCSLLSDFL
jgi:hypothetical protein